ncbi:MAG: hypothetical protein IPI46_13530 [Bacteroidetes bacterium]|nr:hypothetical protein [Bacteroidota bacterium]
MRKYLLLSFLLMLTQFAKAQIIINEIGADAGNYESNGGDWIELKKYRHRKRRSELLAFHQRRQRYYQFPKWINSCPRRLFIGG